MDKFRTEAAADQIKRAEFQEVVKQAFIRLLDDPQIKKEDRGLACSEMNPSCAVGSMRRVLCGGFHLIKTC
jgi:hypothetical protein